MDRREFLQKAALTGLAVVAPSLAMKQAYGQSVTQQNKYTGPFWIFINANGGWDPTDFIDPKGDADKVNHYATGDIGTAGAITYAPHAPVPIMQGQNKGMMPTNEMPLADFFNKWWAKMLVIRGIDLSTNGHSEGLRHSFSGKLGDGNPSLAALIAGTYAPFLPTSYLTGGGYDATFGTVGATRIGNPGVLQSIAFPNVINPTAMLKAGETRGTFQRDSIVDRIEKTRKERYEHMREVQRLPRIRDSISALYTAGLDQDTLKQVSEYLPTELSKDRFESQVQIAIAAYKAGATISMSIGFGGFDTHGNHDATHLPQMMQLAHNVDYLWTEADRQGVADKMTMMLSSEMGRTPHYNQGNGKDHWSVTSALMMGAGIPGNRVIGGTTNEVAALKIDKDTLATLPDPKDPNGIPVTPALIHWSLRNMAGVKESFKQAFPIYPDPPGGVDLFKA